MCRLRMADARLTLVNNAGPSYAKNGWLWIKWLRLDVSNDDDDDNATAHTQSLT